ncbi:hypothetical protein RHGRI_011032 [Rhododendron griersonianum]|uniref:Uncharacterized protein n=1 Tax=Rhododendron griersonianum TaxID=479676 RepID=A0AAV6KL82_9ERIC|nr:hypothetical protein RHGRI_011032 [Rhododendron griersonianum]
MTGTASRLLVTGQGNALLTACQDSRHAKTTGGQGMASRLHVTGQGNALLTAGQDQGWPRHDSRHAKRRGGQGMASRLHLTGQGNALLTACQDQGWPRHGKPITCHRASQCIAHVMPKEGVAKAWQADGLSPGKAMHCSRHAKTKVGQDMASKLLGA